jgi:uncharacterized protein (DUF1684 family)
MTRPDTDDHGFAAWLKDRKVEIGGPGGHLALTGTYEEPKELTIAGVPGVWSAVPQGLSVVTEASDQLIVNGLIVSGSILLRAEDLADVTISAPGVILKTYMRDRRPVVRTYESAASRRAAFDDIDRFAYDSRWRVAARLDEFPEAKVSLIPYQRDGLVREHEVIGRLLFRLEDRELSVLAFGGHELPWFVFSDETTGRTTYPSGRFLDVEDINGLIIDFNRAYLPPCAFSDHYNCPLPPAENRLTVTVAAGERSARWRDDEGVSHGE